MLPPSLVIFFASSLLVITSAVPKNRSLHTLTRNDVNPSTFSNSSLPIVFSANTLTDIESRRPTCFPNDPDIEPAERLTPITDRADCIQAVENMLSQGPDEMPLVWDTSQRWVYDSCGVFLVPSPRLPIHRATFSRTEIAECAENVRLACVNEENGYRGGIVPIGAGVFQVSLAGKPGQPSLGEWEEGIVLSMTAIEK